MNINTAKILIASLNPGMFAGRDWFGPGRAVVYFRTGYARDTAADYGLSAFYNSGAAVEARVVVTDRYVLKALRKAHPGDS